MKLARITQTKRGRQALFDETGTFLFSVDEETLAKSGLAEGSEVGETQLEMLRVQSDTRRAKDKALSYLSLRDYSARELYDKLCLKFDEPSCAVAVAEMKRLGLLDDEAFALHRAKYLAQQQKSTRQIAQHLAEKGIDRDTIAAVLEEIEPADEDACYALIQKSYRTKLAAGQRDKVIAALGRRGFAYGDIKDAVERCETQMRCEDDV